MSVVDQQIPLTLVDYERFASRAHELATEALVMLRDIPAGVDDEYGTSIGVARGSFESACASLVRSLAIIDANIESIGHKW